MTRVLGLVVLAIGFSSNAGAEQYSGVIAEVQPNHESYDCFYFRLEGLTTVVPASPGGWFAISRSQFGAKDAYAAVLAARAAGVPIKVSTGTNSICGHAQAVFITL